MVLSVGTIRFSKHLGVSFVMSDNIFGRQEWVESKHIGQYVTLKLILQTTMSDIQFPWLYRNQGQL